MVGAATVYAAYMTGQLLRARAGLQLTESQRSQVVTVSAYRSAARLILVMGLGIWLFPVLLLGVPIALVIKCGLVLFAVPIAVWLHISYFRKLRALGLPATYVQSHERARYIVYAGGSVGLALVHFGVNTP